MSTSTCAPVGRFAPTPSGKLHLGNLYSFLIAYLAVKQQGGSMRLRIEDLDVTRTKQEYADSCMRMLDAFGLEWEDEVVYQSQRTEAYLEALAQLEAQDLVYPCFCSRADLHAANAPHFGEEYVYAGTCRNLSIDEQQQRQLQKQPSTRVKVPAEPICFEDTFQGAQCFDLTQTSGDFIIRRSDKVFAYQLAVVVDDAAMGITSVVRGVDLITSAPRQLFLQNALRYEHPIYGHVPIMINGAGERLAKRKKDVDVEYLLTEQGVSAESILGTLAFSAGIIPERQPISADELVKNADLHALNGLRSINAPSL